MSRTKDDKTNNYYYADSDTTDPNFTDLTPIGEGVYKNKFGKKHHNSNVIYQIKEGQVLNTFYGCYEAERKTGIDKSRINACCNGRAKTAGGYEWKYTLEELGLED